MGYNNGNERGGESGLVSPHASSEKLEESHSKYGSRSKMDSMEKPKSSYGKKVNDHLQKSPHNNMHRVTN